MNNNKASKFLPYGQQTIEDDDIESVIHVLQSDYLTTGPKAEEFEKALSSRLGVKEAIVCGNGTHALHLACMAANIEVGDAAIVPTMTFLATANAIRYCGAEVIFADIDPQTGLLTPDILRQVIAQNKGKNIKAVLPVHLAGQSVDLQEIRKIADQNNLKVIADSCHALGTTYKGHEIGSCTYEDFATYSFHPVKTIAMGEGGAVTMNNSEIADRLRKLRSHGMIPKPDLGPWIYEMPELGYNYRASDIHCALGLSQLKKLDRFIQRRKELAALYDELLKPLAPIIKPPKRVPSCDPAWHLYTVRIDFDQIDIGRAELMDRLKEKGIGTQVHYIPVHTQPYYQAAYGTQNLPGAEQYYSQILSLPLFPAMKEEDVHFVIKSLEEILIK